MSYAISNITTSYLQAVAPPADEPLWRVVLRDFPLDASAITLYVLLAGTLAFMWWANSRSGKGPRPEARVREGDDTVESGGPDLPRTPVTPPAPQKSRPPRRAA